MCCCLRRMRERERVFNCNTSFFVQQHSNGPGNESALLKKISVIVDIFNRLLLYRHQTLCYIELPNRRERELCLIKAMFGNVQMYTAKCLTQKKSKFPSEEIHCINVCKHNFTYQCIHNLIVSARIGSFECNLLQLKMLEWKANDKCVHSLFIVSHSLLWHSASHEPNVSKSYYDKRKQMPDFWSECSLSFTRPIQVFQCLWTFQWTCPSRSNNKKKYVLSYPTDRPFVLEIEIYENMWKIRIE